MLLASDYDKSKYFKGTDLEREKKFRIKSVTPEVLTGDKGQTEEKLCLWFTNDKRGLPLNKTNLRAMKGAFGDPVAGWVGKVIALFPMMADNGKPGLRVRILPPKQAATAAAPAQPVSPSGNGAAAAAPPPPVAPAVDPELLEPDPRPTSAEIDNELNGEIPEKW